MPGNMFTRAMFVLWCWVLFGGFVVGQAVRRHPWWVALAVLVGCAAALWML